MNAQQEPCCMEFNPTIWDEKVNNWKNKKFVKDSIFAFFHIPFGIGKKIPEMWGKVESAGASKVPHEEVLILFTDPSPFKSEILISVEEDVPNMNNIELTGTYISKVYDGPYDDAPKFMKDMQEYLEKQGKVAKKFYIHNPYCPDCAKHYGHNYAILFAEV